MFTNVTLIYFVLLIPLAGFIAWAGDRIGHKTGKRRQSLFGLRPRHTAMVFTIGSGMAIVLVSFGLFYALSESFRVVVRDGAQLYQHNRDLKAENLRQAQLLTLTRQTAKTAQEETATYYSQRQEAEKSLKTTVEELQEAERKRGEAEKSASEARNNFDLAAKGRDKAQKELSLAQSALTEVQRGLNAKTTLVRNAELRLSTARKRAATAEEGVKSAKAQFKAAIAERDAARNDVLAAKKETADIQFKALRILGEQATQAKNDIAEINRQLAAKNADYTDLQVKTDTLRSDLAKLTEEMTKRRQEYDKIVSNTQALRNKQITFQVGEEVERINLRSGYNLWRMQGMLRAFLGNAAKKAERRGAARGGEDRAVFIAPQAVTVDNKPVEIGGKGEEDDAIRAAAETIRKLNQEVVILAVSRVNAVTGEPVAVDLRVYRNPIVLREGEKISETIISGNGTTQETANALATYMSREVHQKLVTAGMLPVLRGGENDQEASETGQPASEFTLNGGDWLKLVEDVRRAGTAARVQIYAAKDLRAGDPLALRFSVHEQPSDQAINKP